MSPRKSGHWASLQQAMAPVQNQEENPTQPVQETVEEQVVQMETTVSQTSNSGSFMDDEFEIPANAFSLFDDEAETTTFDVVDDSQNAVEELNDSEKQESIVPESVNVVAQEVATQSMDDDFEIPADAFSLFDDEEDKPVRPAKEKKASKSVAEKPVEKSKSADKSEQQSQDKSDKKRKPHKEKKDKNSSSVSTEETCQKVASEHVSEAIASCDLDDSVVHSAETQTPIFYPVHQTEVAPVTLSEDTVATESTPTQWSATSLLDDLIPDSEIERVNQKPAKNKDSDKKASKKASKMESKPAKVSKQVVPEDDDDILFDIPANAFAIPEDKIKPESKKSESKPACDKKREKVAKTEPVQEVSKRVPLPEEDDFDIPADAFSMFEDDVKSVKPVTKPRPAKSTREPKPVREEREGRFEKEVREPRSRRREPVYEEESDEYPDREQRRPERVAKPARRPVEDTEEEVPPVRKVRETRDGEVRRPVINIPSWRDVMDVLIDMNLNRRRETERPSRTARGPRNSEAFKPENYEDVEEKYERQDRNSAPRRRQRRPE